MKFIDFLIVLLIIVIWGVNFFIIKFGLIIVDLFILVGICFIFCVLLVVFFIKKLDILWCYIIGYGFLFGIGLWGIVNLGIKVGVFVGIVFLVL